MFGFWTCPFTGIPLHQGGLLYNTVSILDYVVLSSKMTAELERIRKKQSWLKQGTILEFAWKDRRKLRETSFRLSSVSAEIQSEHLPNTCIQDSDDIQVQGPIMQAQGTIIRMF
jgi:hypothetical protein